ncbi:hypothetical protein FS837_007909 [Tulasnella sp. UAMH 9824]|nr:hypothetical protein FS837_007909 [Tulasnella sp. UAMH 9824]
MDRHWLHPSEKRNDPEYFAEAFQRLILQFLIKHNGDDDNSFMNQTIDSNPRELKQPSIQVPWSSTTSPRSYALSQGKRPGASNTAEQSDPKRRRTTQEPETDRNSEN